MKKGLLLILVLASLMLLAGGLVAQDMPDAIEVGAVISRSGPFAGGAAQIERGYMMAVEQINAAGGVQVGDVQLPISLTILDDESDPTKTVSALEELGEQGVVAYLGGFSSTLNAAAAAVAELNGIPYIGVAFALWDVHQQGYEYLFSPFPKSPDLAVTTFDLLDTIDEAIRPTRVGIVQESTDWGIEMAGFWTEEAEARGYEVVLHEEYAPGNQDFTDIILAAQEAEVQILLALPTPPDGVTLFKQMGEQDWAPEFSYIVSAPDVPTSTETLGEEVDKVLLDPGCHNTVDIPGL
jgi:branched-chain amino acid transport system substrate-binding protein